MAEQQSTMTVPAFPEFAKADFLGTYYEGRKWPDTDIPQDLVNRWLQSVADHMRALDG